MNKLGPVAVVGWMLVSACGSDSGGEAPGNFSASPPDESELAGSRPRGDSMVTPVEAELPAVGRCGVPAGQFRISYVSEGGSCGALDSEVVNLADEGHFAGTVGTDCIGSSRRSADGCDIELSMTCPTEMDPGVAEECSLQGGLCDPATITIQLRLSWLPTLAAARGALTVESAHTRGDCVGLYQIALDRL